MGLVGREKGGASQPGTSQPNTEEAGKQRDNTKEPQGRTQTNRNELI